MKTGRPKEEGLLFKMPDTTLKISNQTAFSHVGWYIDTGKVTWSPAAQNATIPAFTCIDTLLHFNISHVSSWRRYACVYGAAVQRFALPAGIVVGMANVACFHSKKQN